MAVKYDPLLGTIRIKDTIPQYDSDPSSPKAEEAWVLDTETGGNQAGNPMGLLLTLTYSEQVGVGHTYTFKYRTKEGTTVSTSLS